MSADSDAEGGNCALRLSLARSPQNSEAPPGRHAWNNRLDDVGSLRQEEKRHGNDGILDHNHAASMWKQRDLYTKRGQI